MNVCVVWNHFINNNDNSNNSYASNETDNDRNV